VVALGVGISSNVRAQNEITLLSPNPTRPRRFFRFVERRAYRGRLRRHSLPSSLVRLRVAPESAGGTRFRSIERDVRPLTDWFAADMLSATKFEPTL